MMRLTAVICICLLSACGGGGSDGEPPIDNQGPAPHETGSFEVVVLSFDSLDDAGRRAVPTTVYAPNANEPFPVVVISHGAGGSRNGHAYLARHLAGHGFVVIVPEHVGSSLDGVIAVRDAQSITFGEALLFVTQDPGEYQARSDDVSFLLDQAVVWNTTNAFLTGRIDIEHVGVVGHSYGAFTALICGGALAGVNSTLTSFRDARVDAIVALSPQGTGSTGNFEAASYAPVTLPALLISGSLDGGFQGQPASWRKESYDNMPVGDKWFLSLENTTHLHFAEGFDTLERLETHRIVASMTAAFLRVFLKGRTQDRAPYLNEAYADSHTGATIPDVVWSEK